jgi:hypothetical protein
VIYIENLLLIFDFLKGKNTIKGNNLVAKTILLLSLRASGLSIQFNAFHSSYWKHSLNSLLGPTIFASLISFTQNLFLLDSLILFTQRQALDSTPLTPYPSMILSAALNRQDYLKLSFPYFYIFQSTPPIL